jgi:DNA-binding response OmpR family regulator
LHQRLRATDGSTLDPSAVRSENRPMATVLVVEDDESLRLALVDNLEDDGHRVRAAATGAEAWAQRAEVDLVLLDVMLPDTDGYTLCRRLREEGHPARVLMLTARSLEDDLVRGLDAGADDYLAKPYRLRELLARVRALLRRGGGATGEDRRFGRFVLERAARRVTDTENREQALTRTEFDLLLLFLDHPGRAWSRDAILDRVWGRDVVVDGRTVDNFVSNLKKKLGWDEGAGWAIRTVRGVGYRFELG